MNAKPPLNTQVSPVVVGVDLGGVQIRSQVLQDALARSRPIVKTLGENLTPDHVASRISDVIQEALTDAKTSLDKISAIGIGVPAPVNFHEGEVYTSPNLPTLDRVRLRDLVESVLEKDCKTTVPPIFVDNDANVAALGEYMFGAGRGCSHMVYLTISTGIGAGVIINGELLRGAIGTAAELGHMTIYGNGSHCRCGNIGCLETIASGRAIVAHARTVARINVTNPLPGLTRPEWGAQDDDRDWPSLENIQAVAAAADKDDRVNEIIKEAARALGLGLVNIIHIFNPQKIILGGSVIQILGTSLIDPAEQLARVHAMKAPARVVEIVPAQLGDRVGFVGAGAFAASSIRGAAKKGPGTP